MSGWPCRTLGDICDEVDGIIQTGPFGSQLHESDYSQEGIPVVMPKDIIQGRVSTDGIARIGADHVERLSRHKLKIGDIVYGRRGDIGRQALITPDQEGWLCGTGCLRLSLGETIVKPLFLHYYLRQKSVICWISNKAVGATMPNLNTGILRSVPVLVPPLPAQQRIASFLSAYDDLIENNLRRIKILEEMARALYHEWFVEFKCHGTRTSEGSPPNGWKLSRLGEHLTALEAGTRPKGGVRDEIDGVPSIGAENIDGIGCHKYESEKHVSREFFQQMKRGVVRERDVAIYKDGAYIGKSSYFRDGFPHAECCVNEHVFLLRPDRVRLTPNALYLWLQEPDTLHAIRATNANAAQPGINQQSVNGLELVLPDPETARKFEKITEPLFAEIINLAKRNRNLRRTRDLLLPRLLSGKIAL